MNWEELKDENTVDLVDYINSMNDPEYVELGEAAFITLTFRYREDLIKKCIVLARKWKRDDDDAIELANRVFHRFLKYPRYRHSECKTGDVDKCFKRYLYKIADREVIGLFNPKYSPYDGTENVITSLIDSEKEYEPEKLKVLIEYEKKLDQLFVKLSQKHKIIYLTYLCHEKEGYNLPGALLAELREILGGLSQNTLRIYKKEAIEHVRKELQNA
nr:sigma-70 family RNA polymerase sigma factor [Pseudopedobacter sp.]